MHHADGLALEALEHGGVLAVDREQPPSPTPPGPRSELAGGDETLLVRQGEIDAMFERPDRRREPCEADDGVEDDVRFRLLEELGQVAADLRHRREPAA